MSKRIAICTICNKEYNTRNVRSVACCVAHLNQWKSITYKGRKFTPEHIAKLNIAKQRENVVKYGDFECSACKKHFETNTSLRSHKSYCSAKQEALNVTCEICCRVFVRQRNLTWHLKIAHDEERQKVQSVLVQKGIETRKPQKRNSGAELIFFERLKEIHGSDVIHTYRIDGINHEYDFYVPTLNLIIEFDGDYWHGNPLRHQLTPKMKSQYCLDKVYTEAARKRGFDVKRVWHSESAEYPQKIRDM
jgi:hypothetical protein